ncbi:MAG: prenyltransferase/squalene oxidase repeat-containing protein [bacterium]
MNTHTPAPALTGERTADYFEPSYRHRLLTMLHGLRCPCSSREYKAAAIEMQRLAAPAAAVLLPFLAVSLLLLMESANIGLDRIIDFQWIEADPVKPLTELPDPVKHEPPPEETSVNIPSPNVPVSSETPTPNQRVSLVPKAFDSVLPVKSFVILTSLVGSREPGARDKLIAQYLGDQPTEDAVLRALRWLKKNQQPDGSWNSQKIAMTGLATLTFLAHGEKPGGSAEFGETVRKALEFLMSNQMADGRFNGMDAHEYAHPIATYALCEAYGMTLNPNVKTAAEQALAPIIAGQHPTGGWTYKMDPNADNASGTYRDDTSYMGWCAQALKAAKLAKLHVEGLEKAAKLTVKGFQKNAEPNGGFGYTSPGQGGLTGVGTLCLQLFGAFNEPEVKKSLDRMDGWQPCFDTKTLAGASPQYACYYATQAKFHAGGKRWENWNTLMKSLYVQAQQVEKSAIKDAQGKDADIGWWVNGDAHTDRPVMDTCLTAMQLMVYYRYLPTTSTAAVQADAPVMATSTDTDDIIVQERTL